MALRKSLPAEESQPEPAYTLGEIKVDFERRLVFRGQEEVHLTPIEYKLLSVLIKHRGKVVTHRQLLERSLGALHIPSKILTCASSFSIFAASWRMTRPAPNSS